MKVDHTLRAYRDAINSR